MCILEPDLLTFGCEYATTYTVRLVGLVCDNGVLCSGIISWVRPWQFILSSAEVYTPYEEYMYYRAVKKNMHVKRHQH